MYCKMDQILLVCAQRGEGTGLLVLCAYVRVCFECGVAARPLLLQHDASLGLPLECALVGRHRHTTDRRLVARFACRRRRPWRCVVSGVDAPLVGPAAAHRVQKSRCSCLRPPHLPSRERLRPDERLLAAPLFVARVAGGRTSWARRSSPSPCKGRPCTRARRASGRRAPRPRTSTRWPTRPKKRRAARRDLSDRVLRVLLAAVLRRAGLWRPLRGAARRDRARRVLGLQRRVPQRPARHVARIAPEAAGAAAGRPGRVVVVVCTRATAREGGGRDIRLPALSALLRISAMLLRQRQAGTRNGQRREHLDAGRDWIWEGATDHTVATVVGLPFNTLMRSARRPMRCCGPTCANARVHHV